MGVDAAMDAVQGSCPRHPRRGRAWGWRPPGSLMATGLRHFPGEAVRRWAGGSGAACRGWGHQRRVTFGLGPRSPCVGGDTGRQCAAAALANWARWAVKKAIAPSLQQGNGTPCVDLLGQARRHAEPWRARWHVFCAVSSTPVLHAGSPLPPLDPRTFPCQNLGLPAAGRLLCIHYLGPLHCIFREPECVRVCVWSDRSEDSAVSSSGILGPFF